jgi:hypothetical protein
MKSKAAICWIDYLRRIAPRQPPVVPAVVTGLLVHAAALCFLAIARQPSYALHLPFILGTIGIIWSLSFYWIASEHYKYYLNSLKTALDAEDRRSYSRKKNAHIIRIGNNRIYFIATVVLWVIGILLVSADMYNVLPDYLPHPLKAFPPEWRTLDDFRLLRLASIWVFGLPVTLLLWTLGQLIILHTFFMVRISRLKYVPSQYLCYLYIQPLIRVNILAAASWSIGVALFGLLFRNDYSVKVLVFLGLLGMVATLAFFWPIWFFEKKLTEIRLHRVNVLAPATQIKLNLVSKDPNKWSEVFLLEENLAKLISDSSSPVGLWRYIFYLMSSFIIPILTAVLGTWITNLLESGIKK